MGNELSIIYYYRAKSHVYEKGFFKEVYSQERRSIDQICKSDFFREYAWVVLSSGLSEKVVLSVFPKLTKIFNNWRNPLKIIDNHTTLFPKALRVFRNKQKISALFEMARYLVDKSISFVTTLIKKHGLNYLMQFKYLGPATSAHLAKNIGFNFAKPDRHLMRICNHFGFSCVDTFCEEIAYITGDKKSVVDLILWRYATLKRNYLA